MRNHHHRFRRRFRGLYRSRKGVLAGVCQGIADFFDFRVFWIRFTMLGLFVISGFFPILAVYILAAFLMKPEPSYRY